MASTNGSTNGHSTDEVIDSLYSFWPGTTSTPPALPEAASSANVRLQLHGYEVQVTLRGTSEEDVLARLERLLQRYPKPQAQPQASSSAQPQGEGYCQRHAVPMTLNTKDGRQWWSHRVGDTWCKGR